MIRRTEQVVRQWVAVHGEAKVRSVNIDLQDIPGVRVVRGGDVDIYAVLDGEVDMGQAQNAKVVIFETDGSSVSMRPSHHPVAGVPNQGYRQEQINEQVMAFVADGVNFYEVITQEINIDVDDIKLSPSENPPPGPPAFNFNIEGADPPEEDDDVEEDGDPEEDDDVEENDNPFQPPSPRVW